MVNLFLVFSNKESEKEKLVLNQGNEIGLWWWFNDSIASLENG